MDIPSVTFKIHSILFSNYLLGLDFRATLMARINSISLIGLDFNRRESTREESVRVERFTGDA